MYFELHVNQYAYKLDCRFFLRPVSK